MKNLVLSLIFFVFLSNIVFAENIIALYILDGNVHVTQSVADTEQDGVNNWAIMGGFDSAFLSKLIYEVLSEYDNTSFGYFYRELDSGNLNSRFNNNLDYIKSAYFKENDNNSGDVDVDVLITKYSKKLSMALYTIADFSSKAVTNEGAPEKGSKFGYIDLIKSREDAILAHAQLINVTETTTADT